MPPALHEALCILFRLRTYHRRYLTAENLLNPDVSLNLDNLEALCLDCHNTEHFGRGGATAAGLTFDVNGNIVQKGTSDYE